MRMRLLLNLAVVPNVYHTRQHDLDAPGQLGATRTWG
jgi:hypothetical protein